MKIDEDICKHLGVEPHPRMYCHYWYDTIGYLIATDSKMYLGGADLVAKIVEWDEGKEQLTKILEYLTEHYTSTNWYETKSNPRDK